MSRITILLALGITGGLLASCGSNRPAGASAPVTTRGPSSALGATASGQLTRSQALAFAHAVNLRAADVPGFRASSERRRETAAEKRLEREMLECVGSLGPGDTLAEVSSTNFQREALGSALEVSSDVGVARTTALAAKALAELRGSHTRGCFSHYLQELGKSPAYRGGTISPFSIASGTPPAPGATGSFAWRVRTTIKVQSVRVPVYADILGFVYGPTEVTLFSSGVPRPFPARAEEHLFSLLLERARKRGA